MASTDLTAIFAANAEEFAQTVVEESTKSSFFFQSGAVATSPFATQLANTSGPTGQRPIISDVPDTESAQSSDNEAEIGVPEALTGGAEVMRRHFRNKKIKSSDLVVALGDIDPIGVAVNRMAPYWGREYDTQGALMVGAIAADNIANDGSDMVVELYDGILAPTAANNITSNGIIDAETTIGDVGQSVFALIVMHSQTHGELRKLNLIADIPDARGETTIPFYQNKRVVVSDNMPAVAGAGGIVYTTALVGQGVFEFGVGFPRVPAAIQREELEGNGEGTETLVSRAHYVLHPTGMTWAEPVLADGKSPSNAQIGDAANWSRLLQRKNMPMAFVNHSIGGV